MYYLVKGIIYLLSLLPFSVLYLLSDFLYLIAYYIVGYRRDVVYNNLFNAFPEKSEAERKILAKHFYHNFTDSFIEAIKLLSISKKEFLKRCSSNFEVLEELIPTGKNIQLLVCHQFSPEFFSLLYSHKFNERLSFVLVYMPISNTNINRLYYKIRSRFGTVMVSARNFRVEKQKFESKQYILTLAADQNPSYIQGAMWMNFFGKPAPFLPGPAKSAIKGDTAIVFVDFIKIKRGYFHFENSLLTKSGANENAEHLTRSYRTYIENIISKQPSNYLWTHKRWKHEFKEAYQALWADD